MLRPQAQAIDLGGKPDLKDPDLYMRDDHHAVFRKLRAQEPVYWNPEADAAGFWGIRKGDKVVMRYASANRDEDAFDDPYRFDVTRYTKPDMPMQLGEPRAETEMPVRYTPER
ncbi:MAG: hypothetical protein RIC04_12790 [Parvibaculum sp.]|uniref:hypothetical protein n=1 Tax=Parvibaculum sp. TaxID=2024848 RepID=UPI0032ECD86F